MVILLVLMVLLTAGCQQTQQPASSKSAPASQTEDQASSTESEQGPEVRIVNPVDAGEPDPLAVRLCNVLHMLPEKRKAQCCGIPAAATLAGECTRTLSITLRDKAATLDPAAVDRCAEEVSRQLEGCDWITGLTPSAPQGCRRLIHGQLQAGAHCRSSLECRDGLFCRGSAPTTLGVCTEPGAVGATCAGTMDTLETYTKQVDSDTYHPPCGGFCRGGRCAAFVALGGDCHSSKQCAPGRHCVSGHCTDEAPPKIGKACSGSFCEAGAVCLAGQCTSPKKAGEPCTHPFECQAACIKPPDTQVGTCGMQCGAWSLTGATSPSR